MASTTLEQDPVVSGPPKLAAFAHCSLPCRDVAEGKRFYMDVLGGEIRVDTPTFALFVIAGTEIGIGSEGCTFLQPRTEYPHIAFFVEADEMVRMKAWLSRCGIPSSNFWTRQGIEALMFFRDPSGNMIELYCQRGMPGADQFPRSGPAGGGIAVDLEALRYTKWTLPSGCRSRVPTN
jgi:catechol 2,3-dioxygenase-like lactoylglutathione lyase family enzyme